jgi:cysteine desulfurase
MIYFDNSATTKPEPAVTAAVLRTLEEDFGNPSSLYRIGLTAEKLVKESRERVAAVIGAKPSEVFFTSGGTESDSTVLRGVWESRRKQGRRIITTSVEHPAILRVCEDLERQGADIVCLPVNADGSFDMQAFKAALTPDTILVSIMLVNNENGAIFPLREVRETLSRAGSGALLHTDAVQGLGKVSCQVSELGVDFMSVSAHKIHGPKGVGALYVRSGVHLPPFILGGGQESGFRSGTENVPGIAGFGAAALILAEEGRERSRRMGEVREHLKARLLAEVPDTRYNGPDAAAPSVLNISFLGCRGEVLLHTLEQDGIYVSTGSACSSNSKKKGSHVLKAMGLKDEEIEGAIRFSFCGNNTIEEADIVVEKLKAAVSSQRRLRSFMKR